MMAPTPGRGYTRLGRSQGGCTIAARDVAQTFRFAIGYRLRFCFHAKAEACGSRAFHDYWLPRSGLASRPADCDQSRGIADWFGLRWAVREAVAVAEFAA